MELEYLRTIFLEKKRKGYEQVSLIVKGNSDLHPRLERVTIEMGCIVIGGDFYIPIENIISFSFYKN